MRWRIAPVLTLICATIPPAHAAGPADRLPALFATAETTLNRGDALSVDCDFAQAPIPYTATIGMATKSPAGTIGGGMFVWYGNSTTWVNARVGAAGVDEEVGAGEDMQLTNLKLGVTGVRLESSVDGLVVKAGVSMWGAVSSCSAVRNDSTITLWAQDPGRSTYAVATDFTPDSPIGGGVAMSSSGGTLSPGSALLNSSYVRHSDGLLLAFFNIGRAGQASATGPSGTRQSGPLLPIIFVVEQTSGYWTYHVDYSAVTGADGTMLWLMEL